MHPVNINSIESNSSYKSVYACLCILIFLQTLYAVGFIARSSFTVGGERYFCLFDDAMISMRYADNWADGEGLVWNAGENVEGYTNFGWTIILGLIHFLNLSPVYTCLAVQIFGVLICWACLIAVVRLCENVGVCAAGAICALCMVSVFYVLLYFTLLGMETGLLTCLITFALAGAAKCLNENKASIVPMLWVIPAALVRIDSVPVAMFIYLFILIFTKQNRWMLTIGFAAFVVVLSAHFVWRHGYYGEWLPNTYYLKATNWPIKNRMMAGVRYAKWTFLMFIVPTLFVLLVRDLFNKKHVLLLVPFLMLCGYQAYVGGDAWPLNRMVIPASLAFIVLCVEGIENVSGILSHKIKGLSKITLQAVFTIICIVSMNAVHWDHLLLIARPQTVNDNEYNITLTRAIEKVGLGDSSVLVAWAGALPYFSGLRCYDSLGKCDTHIAHMKVLAGNDRPGHNKYDLSFSVNNYEPDIIAHAYMYPTPDFIRHNYTPVVVEVDGGEVPLMVRTSNIAISKEGKVGWREYADIASAFCEQF